MKYGKLFSFWKIAAAIALLSSGASAHHSIAMFDMDKTIPLQGVVKEFQWTNPHAWLQVMVPDASGKTVEWTIEMRGLGVLSRTGWKKTSFTPGQKVTLVVHPMRDGSPAGALAGAKDEHGNQIGGDYPSPKAKGIPPKDQKPK